MGWGEMRSGDRNDNEGDGEGRGRGKSGQVE